MSENQEPRSGGKGVSLNDIIWFIASRWRKILLFALAAAVLSGGFTAVSYAVKLGSGDYLESARAKNAQQKAAYQQNYDRLSSTQRHLKAQLEFQAAYTDSPLFQMDPYAVNTITTVYYASAEGASPMAVLAAYGARFTQIDVSEVIPAADKGISGYFIRYSLANSSSNKEDLTVNVTGSAADTMAVTVIGPTKEQAEALQALVDRAAQEAGPEIARNVAPHTLVRLARAASVSEDAELVYMHSEYESRLKVARDQYDGVTTELNKLKSPAALIVSGRAALKESVKKAVLGAAAGLILALAYLFLYVDLRGRILSADDLMGNLPADYLGSLNADLGRGKLDSFIARQLGLAPGRTREQELDFIAANLTRAGAPAASAALVGGAEPALIEALARDLAPLTGELKLVPGGDLLSSAEALRAYRDSEAVIFVETVDRSGRSSVRRAFGMAAADGKKVLGSVLTGEARRK